MKTSEVALFVEGDEHSHGESFLAAEGQGLLSGKYRPPVRAREKLPAVRDWVKWHHAYDEPGSSLARRLGVVRQRIDEALTMVGCDSSRVLSLCSGDGRDLIPVLARLPSDRTPLAILVEKTEGLAEAAKARALSAGLSRVSIVLGDAGDPAVFIDHLPVNLLLLCGIFGNISTEDIKTTIASVPSLLAPGGFVIWTRGNQEPDLRERIRQWFVEAGLDEVSFDGHPEPFGVGVSRRIEPRPAVEATLRPRLFTFVR